MGDLISLTGQYHRDIVGRAAWLSRNGVQPARAETSSGALHKLMINSRPSGIPRFHVSISTNVNAADVVSRAV